MPRIAALGQLGSRGFGATLSVKAFRYNITSNTSNINLRSAIVSAGWNGVDYVIATVQSGVTVFSTSTGSYAMTISGSFPGGLLLVNNGTILGRGGQGGKGLSDPQTFDDTGGNGGPALLVQTAVSINNVNRIAGGGGGGGGGALSRDPNIAFLAGGGGGGGIGNGTAGARGTAGINGSAGQAGTLSSAGDGGSGASSGGFQAGQGGTGGGFGSSGSSGTGPFSGFNFGGPGSGGSAGAAVVGNSNITWIATGTRNGSIS